MFEKIVLRRSESGYPVSAGQIAQALLYYQRLHIFIDPEALLNLLKKIGPEQMIDLLQRSNVTAVYCEELTAVGTDHGRIESLPKHQFATLTL